MMFREIRKNKFALSKEKAMDLVEQGEYAVISVLGPHGYPYGFPMSYVVLDGNIYFHGAQRGYKMDCLRHSDKVSFAVVGRTKVVPEDLATDYESVVVFGRAAEVTGLEKERALMALVSKYSPGFEEKGRKSLNNEFGITAVIRIEIEHITGKGYMQHVFRHMALY